MIDTPRIIHRLLAIPDISPQRLTPENEGVWRTVLSLARKERIYHSLSGLILEQKGILPPHALQEEMRRDISANIARSILLGSQISGLARLFREAGIPLLFLKGAADLVRGIYPPGWRFMQDIDVMVSETHLARASALLAERGYSPLPGGVEQIHHQPELSHRDHVGVVELHTSPYPFGLRSGRELPGIWERAETVAFRGGAALVPDPTDHLWILMRSDIIERIAIPRLFDVIEYGLFVERGLLVDFEEIARRARVDGMQNLLPAFSRACVWYGGMEPFAGGNGKLLDRWEDWSLTVQRKDLRNTVFHSARRRFTAVRFLPGRGWRSRIGFGLRLARDILAVDRFTPGPYRKLSLSNRISVSLKLTFSFLISAVEYGAFVLKRRNRR